MAYVQPKSNIYLIKGCPCDRSYNNTIYFESKLTQWAYFRDLVTHTFTNQYYQRYNRGYLRIQANAEDLYEVNYMVFSNSYNLTPTAIPPNSAKIFYCFVDNIEYINENVTEIHYTIDIMQTYMFDYTLGECFVEREHSLTDNLFENRIPEDFDANDFTYEKINQFTPDKTGMRTNYFLLIEYIPKSSYIDYWTYVLETNPSYITYHWENTGTTGLTTLAEGEFRNGTYSGGKTLFIPLFLLNEPIQSPADYHNIETLIDQMIQNNATIVKMYLVPAKLVNLSRNEPGVPINYDDAFTYSYSSTVSIDRRNYFSFTSENTTNYIPKNKKLFNYPYDKLCIVTNYGDEQEYFWEDFEQASNPTNTNYNFDVKGVILAEPEIALIPQNYNGLTTAYAFRITLANFPSVSWSEDSFARLWSENRTKITNGLIQSAIMAVSKTVKIGALTAATGGAGGIALGTLGGGTALSPISGGGTFLNSTPLMTASTNATLSNVVSNTNNLGGANSLQGMIGSKILSHQVASLIDAQRKPDTLNGTQSGSQIPILSNNNGFSFYRKSIKPYYAKMIDNYFTLYGYAVKDHKVPNVISANRSQLRPHWNYIKNELTIVLPYTEGNTKRYVNSDVEEEIQRIFDKGITFWMRGEEVGDYSLNNAPQS